MRCVFVALFTLIFHVALAQTKISGQIGGISKPDTILYNIPFDAWYSEQNNVEIITNKEGFYSVIVPVEKPQSLLLIYRGIKMILYVEPKRNLSITFDQKQVTPTLKFGGDLMIENNFRRDIGLTFFELYPRTWSDSVNNPQEIMSAIRQNAVEALKKLDKIENKKLSPFKKLTQIDIEYFLPAKLWDISWNKDVFSTQNKGRIDKQQWKDALQTAYSQSPVSNDDAIDSYFYQHVIGNYPNFLELTSPGKAQFQSLIETIFKKTFTEAVQEIKARGEKFFEYTLINYGLTGKALEFAIASFINNSIQSGELGYLQEAYKDFSLRFPNSRYRNYINTITVSFFESLSSPNPDNIVFEPGDAMLTSLEDVAKRHKGRIIYIDLWGTWCGPCRQEFLYNKDVKEYYSGKPVDFVYIAFEHSNEPEKLWRQTVKFYNLSGRHILAGKQLSENIENLYKAKGIMSFPGYLLVDKQGNIITLYAERPSEKESLFKQIDQLLE